MFEEGRVWPQSVGSQLAGLCVGSRVGERVLDLCAAPGGKATMLAGDVVAVEVSASRARELEENMRRLGATNVRVVCADGRDLPDDLTGFDRALVDAPVLGARRARRAAGSALALPAAARAAARAPRGRCRARAHRGHDRLLRLHREQRRVRGRRRRGGSRDRPDARRRVAAIPSPTRPEFLQTLPHVHATSGFFIARLRAP